MASKPFYVDIDLNNNKLQNSVVGSNNALSTTPGAIQILGGEFQYNDGLIVRNVASENYVINAIADAATAARITASNGLTDNAGNIELGGTLLHDTTISKNLNIPGFDLNYGTSGTGFNDAVASSVILSDNSVVASGYFTSYNGHSATKIAKINVDGTFDSSFGTNVGTGFNNNVVSLATTNDNKIVAGGYFTTYNGNNYSHIIRLNSDGTVDSGFNYSVSGAVVLGVTVQQSDNSIFISGQFSPNNFVKVLSNGTEDTAFTTNLGTGLNIATYTSYVQTDNTILVGGYFTNVNGTPANRLAKLNSNGTLDTTFATNLGTGFNGLVQVIYVQTDNKILVGGGFTSFNGINVTGLVRLNSDGTADTAFNTNLGIGFDAGVKTIAVNSDNTILVGGDFSHFNNTPASHLVQLNSNGTLDTALNYYSTTLNDTVYTINIKSDSYKILTGQFTRGITKLGIQYLNTAVSIGSTLNSSIDSGLSTYSTTSSDKTSVSKIISGQQSSIITQDKSSVVFAIQNTSNVTNTSSFTPDIVDINLVDSTSNNFTRLHQTTSNIFLNGSNNNVQSNIVIADSVSIASDTNIHITGNSVGITLTQTEIDIAASSSVINISNGGSSIKLNTQFTPDSTFAANILPGLDNYVAKIYPDVNNPTKYIITGQFTTYAGVSRPGIARINQDGSLDNTFNPGTGFNGNITYVLEDPNTSYYYVIGNFSNYNGTAVTNIVRLTNSGTLDNTFVTGNGFSGGGGAAYKLIWHANTSNIYAVGDFTSYNNTSANYIVRINTTDATIDTAFNYGTGFSTIGLSIFGLAIDGNDGHLYVGNNGFTTYNGTSIGWVVKLSDDGSIDTSFTGGTFLGGGGDNISDIVFYNNSIYVAGFFYTYNGVTRNYLLRLNTNGSLDTNFTADTHINATVYKIIQYSGYLYVDVGNDSIYKLNSGTGSIDSAFLTYVDPINTLTNSDLNDFYYDGNNNALFVSVYVSGGTTSIFSKYVIGDAIIITEVPLQYAADYSLNYTDRSLVDKAYVNSLVSGGSGTAGYALTTADTASNGLTKVGNDFQLGGTLSQATSIKLNNFDFTIGSSNTSQTGGTIKLQTNYNTFSSPWDSSTTSTSKMQVGNTNFDIILQLDTPNTSQSGVAVIQSLPITDGTPHLYTHYTVGDETNQTEIRQEANLISIDGTVGAFAGLTYTNDFSANYTNRSLVDKEFVVNYVTTASTSGIATSYKTTITGDNSTTDFTITHNLATRDVQVEVYRNSAPYDSIITTVQRTSTSAIDVIFSVAPTGSDSYRILVRAI